MSWHLFRHVILLLVLIGGVSSCSNPGPVTLNDKIQYSDVIVSGTIKSKVRDGVYSMEVDCVLKDSRADIPGSLNITGVEEEEGGLCFMSEISVGNKYVVFLSSFYSMRYKEQDFGDYTDIINTACGLGVKRKEPVGGSTGVCQDVVHRACPTTTTAVLTRRTKKPRKTTTTTTLRSTTTTLRSTTTVNRSGGGSVDNESKPLDNKNGLGKIDSQTQQRPHTRGMGSKNGDSGPVYSTMLLIAATVCSLLDVM
ncbi:uncharacterized protein LOC134254189 [Saccostrea cucullata]|uniref:uncharacterized protein LOC134254189 n=1 Tax=Saccostrea cuccullata TaxID=36930 RepID=UPI002ED673FC